MNRARICMRGNGSSQEVESGYCEGAPRVATSSFPAAALTPGTLELNTRWTVPR